MTEAHSSPAGPLLSPCVSHTPSEQWLQHSPAWGALGPGSLAALPGKREIEKRLEGEALPPQQGGGPTFRHPWVRLLARLPHHLHLCPPTSSHPTPSTSCFALLIPRCLLPVISWETSAEHLLCARPHAGLWDHALQFERQFEHPHGQRGCHKRAVMGFSRGEGPPRPVRTDGERWDWHHHCVLSDFHGSLGGP